MGIWGEITGVRRSLRLYRKWWHHAAIAVAILSSVVVYSIVSTIVAFSNIALRSNNTYSLTLLHYSLGRTGKTTLDDLDAVSGYRGAIGPHGEIMPIPRAHAPETIRCETPPHYRAAETFVLNGVKYQAIPDRVGQDASERRHCAATAAYAATTADHVIVFMPDTSLVRKQGTKGMFIGIVATIAWLLAYWTVYYRALVPIYVRRRETRRRRRYQEYQVG